MSTMDDDRVLRGRIRTMQIILSSLVAGCLIFMTVAVIVRQAGQINPPPVPIITYIALGFGVIMLAESFILSKIMLTKGLLRIAQTTKNSPGTGTVYDETTDLCDLYQTRMIVTAASREGGTFFLLIAYLIEGTLSSLVGAIVLMAFIAAIFPTFTMVERWVEEQRELLQQHRLGI